MDTLVNIVTEGALIRQAAFCSCSCISDIEYLNGDMGETILCGMLQ